MSSADESGAPSKGKALVGERMSSETTGTWPQAGERDVELAAAKQR